jgi:hypothetical protein
MWWGFENRYPEILDRLVQAPGEDAVAVVEKIAVSVCAAVRLPQLL